MKRVSIIAAVALLPLALASPVNAAGERSFFALQSFIGLWESIGALHSITCLTDGTCQLVGRVSMGTRAEKNRRRSAGRATSRATTSFFPMSLSPVRTAPSWISSSVMNATSSTGRSWGRLWSAGRRAARSSTKSASSPRAFDLGGGRADSPLLGAEATICVLSQASRLLRRSRQDPGAKVLAVNVGEVAAKLRDLDMPEATVETVLGGLQMDVLAHDRRRPWKPVFCAPRRAQAASASGWSSWAAARPRSPRSACACAAG